jgi:hypothetical protein
LYRKVVEDEPRTLQVFSMFCFWDWDIFRKKIDRLDGMFTFYDGHKVGTPVLIEHLDYHSLERVIDKAAHQIKEVLTLKLYVANVGSSLSPIWTCSSIDGVKNLCLRVSCQYSKISSLYTFAFTANIGGKSGVAISRQESKVLTTLQLGQVALWLIFLRIDACRTEARSLSGPATP